MYYEITDVALYSVYLVSGSAISWYWGGFVTYFGSFEAFRASLFFGFLITLTQLRVILSSHIQIRPILCLRCVPSHRRHLEKLISDLLGE